MMAPLLGLFAFHRRCYDLRKEKMRPKMRGYMTRRVRFEWLWRLE